MKTSETMEVTTKKISRLQKDGMNYSILKPKFPISSYVDHFMVAKGHPLFSEERLFPSNKVELFVNLGSRNECQLATSNQKFVFTDTILSGLRSSYLRIFPGEYFFIAGIRFTLFGFNQLFHIPANEITDANYCASDVLGKEIAALRQKLGEQNDDVQILNILEQWMESKLSGTNSITKPWQRVSLSLQFDKSLNQDSLSELMGYSHKHSIQLVKKMAGLSPKLIQRIYRLNSIFDQLHQSPNPDWQSICFDKGYFDQSHFIKDFRAFTGLTPTEILVQKPKDFELKQLR